MNEGWICPRCKRVWAPAVLECDCKPEESPADSVKDALEEFKKTESTWRTTAYYPWQPYYPHFYGPITYYMLHKTQGTGG